MSLQMGGRGPKTCKALALHFEFRLGGRKVARPHRHAHR